MADKVRPLTKAQMTKLRNHAKPRHWPGGQICPPGMDTVFRSELVLALQEIDRLKGDLEAAYSMIENCSNDSHLVAWARKAARCL